MGSYNQPIFLILNRYHSSITRHNAINSLDTLQADFIKIEMLPKASKEVQESRRTHGLYQTFLYTIGNHDRLELKFSFCPFLHLQKQ